MIRKLLGKIFTRRLVTAYIIVIQLAFLLFFVIDRSVSAPVVSHILGAVSVVVAAHIVAKREKDAYKLTWVFLILLFPVFGGIFYLIFYLQSARMTVRKKQWRLSEKAHKILESAALLPDDEKRELGEMPQVRYLSNYAGFPVFDTGNVIYYESGESYYNALLCELEKAERYIFLEYFIISEGEMWSGILEILKRKASEGICVRVIYDDMGCFFRIPQKYCDELKKYGIEAVAFNRFRPVITVDQNNRDHRKIVSIDGKVAFTGGINLADEYINVVDRFGHWKDCGVSIHGKASLSFTLMFLQMWDICKNSDEDYSAYLPEATFDEDIHRGYIQPYADTPIDTENVCEHVYLQIINNAKRYVYINTPYLIIDRSMLSALCLAAKSGVDVRIVTPKRWDKRLVHMTTRSYYRELIKAGVKIHEYSKGFLHSKLLVSDDTTASVGTANLDFRSLYLHFECGVWLYKCPAVADIKKDFLDTLTVCEQINESDCKGNFATRLLQDFLRVFAPLM